MQLLPSEPLLIAARLGGERNDERAAERLGVPIARIQRWNRGGGVPEKDAEALAMALGLLDFEVWPELIERHIRRCETCDEVLVGRKDKRFCGRACREKSPGFKQQRRASQRRRYAVDQEWREAVKRRRRTDYATSTRRAELAKQRIRDAARRAA